MRLILQSFQKLIHTVMLSEESVRIIALWFSLLSIDIIFLVFSSTSLQAAIVDQIYVQGNKIVDSDTILSYVNVKPGKEFSSFDTDDSLRSLFSTGLFSDVQIDRKERRLIVTVEENKTVNAIHFEGNDKVKGEFLRTLVQLKSGSVFSQEKLDIDLASLNKAMHRSGYSLASVSSNVIGLNKNLVDVIFIIKEGERTKISDITFIGNTAYSDRQLIDVISHRKSTFLSWLKHDDIYDSDKLRSDEEKLRVFYFNSGYADFKIISSSAHLDEDKNSYSITITVDEGHRYHFGIVDVDNVLQGVDVPSLLKQLPIKEGNLYSAGAVERSLIKMTESIAESGFLCAEVTPRGKRDFDNSKIDITFFVNKGPCVYIERINISGNFRTRGYVIRREFDISEGDAYNRFLVNKAKKRLESLHLFDHVTISAHEGSIPDRIVLNVDVTDKSTGDISIGGGYSTTAGPVAEVSITEKNFLGRGQYLNLSGGRGENSIQYNISFTEPYFLGYKIAVGLDLSKERLDLGEEVSYSQDVSTIQLRGNALINDKLLFGINYNYKSQEHSGEQSQFISPAILESINQSPYTASTLGYSFIYSTLDNHVLPRNGVYAQFDQSYAGIGGDSNYIRTTGRLSSYHLLSEDSDVVLLGTLGGGHIYALDNKSMRITDYFFHGHQNIRGFESRGLGPRDLVTGDALGGSIYGNFTAELHFPVPLLSKSYGLRLAFFGEAGTLYNNEYRGPLAGSIEEQSLSRSTFDHFSIRSSFGGSIIWDSSFGPLRFDFAHPIHKEEYDRTQFFRFGVSSKF
ncbi:outer membrane protein assembly factor BamA [Candidatus Endowatersipora endosymbiont of Watersipora subatra]|uniref:outer membrane protein assembly factor BamA n=1 Tax=Candidatus Endowatersipora endosymbiont of Watersipora subatra TaxID=3077946 RepID=UPI00312CAD67